MQSLGLDKVGLMLLLVCLFSFTTSQFSKADYHDQYVLAVKQKFAIPENVQNGDHVGTWLKTLTWKSTGSVSFRIEGNFRDVFAINATTGLITINNASGINGKIIRKDTLINLLIKTSDPSGTETDTAQIYVKENSFCKFIDYSYRGTETGQRNQPYNDLDDVNLTPGYGYFLKRGNVIYDETTAISSHKATSSNPTLIAAYGSGNKPRFTSGSNICFYLGDSSGGSGDPDATASQYIYFFDLHIRDYNSAAIYSRRKTTNIGFYNMVINNCDKTDVESTVVLNTSSYSDYTANYSFEVLNCSFDTTSLYCNSDCEKSFIKNGVGPTKVTNTRFGYIEGTGYGLRLSAGHGSIVRHCLFDRSTASESQNNSGIQCRQNNVLIENCIFLNSGNGVFVTNPGTIGPEGQPDRITVRNCYFKGQGLNAIHISPVTTSDLPGTGHVFEDNYMENVANGIDLRDCSNAVIRRNTMAGGKNSGICTGGTEPSNGTMINGNIIYDFGGKEINMTKGSTVKIYNNTVVGTISALGCSGVTTYNNFASNFEGIGTSSNNIDIDDIQVDQTFIDFAGRDLDLKSTATMAIDKGLKTEVSIDHCGLTIVGAPDIGACELLANTPPTEIPTDPTDPVTPPVGDPVVPAENAIYIDPGNASDGSQNGSLEHPFDSWSDVKWVSGKTYMQKRGTAAKVDKIVIGADDVVLSSYGDNGELPKIISETTTYLLSAFEKKNITISNLNIQAQKAVSSLYFLGSTCDNITIQHCVIEGISNGIKIADGQRYTIKYNTISSESEGIQSSAAVNNLYYNIFKNNEVAINIPANVSQAKIYNNVFVGNSESVSVSYADLTLYNNIFYFTAEGQKAIRYLSQKIKSDYNIFYPEQSSFAEISGKSYNTLDQLQQGMKLDLNSFAEDPIFVDVLNNNFKVDRESPAIDNGINVQLTEDYFTGKVPFAKATDIGVFEFAGKKSLVSQSDESASIKVYPNPSKGTVYVNFEEAVLEQESSNEPVISVGKSVLKLVDLTGRVIYKKEVNDSQPKLESFDLSSFTNGIYVVIFENLGKSISKKLVLYR